MENGTREIKWIHTPKTCKECDAYDKRRGVCKLKLCKFPAKKARSK